MHRDGGHEASPSSALLPAHFHQPSASQTHAWKVTQLSAPGTADGVHDCVSEAYSIAFVEAAVTAQPPVVHKTAYLTLVARGLSGMP